MQTSENIRLLDEAFEKGASGNHAEALNGFLSVERLSTDPKDLSALRLYQTYCLMEMGRTDDALDRISSVFGEDLDEPLRANYEYQFARMLYALGRAQDAIAHAENARRIFETVNPELVSGSTARNAQTLLGILLAECKRCAEATTLLQKVTIHDESWEEAKMRLGNCYMEEKQYHEAIECYSILVSSDLKVHPIIRMDALRNIGCSYYWLGEYAKSVNYLMKVKDAYEAYPGMKDRVLRYLAFALRQLDVRENQAKKYDSFNPPQSLQ